MRRKCQSRATGWSKKSRLEPKNDMLGLLDMNKSMASKGFFGQMPKMRRKELANGQ